MEMEMEESKEVTESKKSAESEKDKKDIEKIEPAEDKQGKEKQGEEKQGEEKQMDEKAEGHIARRKTGVLKIILSTTLSIMVVAYVVVAFYYQSHLLPGTVINGHDFSNADRITASVQLQLDMDTDYQMDIIGRDLKNPHEKKVLAQVCAADMKWNFFDIDETVESVFASQNEWLWPITLWQEGQNFIPNRKITFDKDYFFDTLQAVPAFREENMRAPQDACFGAYSEEEGAFVMIPEMPGTELNLEEAFSAIEEAFCAEEPAVDLEELQFYTEAETTARTKALQESLEKANQCLKAKITYDWNGNEIILDRNVLKDWIQIQDTEMFLNQEAIAAFVAEQSKAFDTYGKNRDFKTTQGVTLNLPSGAYGWKTNREAEAEELEKLIRAGEVTAREPIYVSKGSWKGADDIGNTYVEIDLTFQHLYLYQKGQVVLETDFVSGNMSNGNTTPPGVFGLTYKTRNAVLRGRDYVTPVNYWMPFNGNVGMHDATWRSSFGGDIYLTNGSHGCVNLPLDKAEEIYSYMSEGFPIICYYYPAEIAATLTPPVPVEEISAPIPEEDED